MSRKISAIIAHKILAEPKVMGTFVLMIGTLSLGGALISQYVFGLHPCVLCIYQRWPHGIAIALGMATLFLGAQQKQKSASFVLLVASLTFFIGSAIAFYHTGVEQKWWSGTDGCGFPKTGAGDFESFKDALMNAPVARCDEIPWSLLGISMAGYNFMLSLGAGLISLAGSICVIRKANKML